MDESDFNRVKRYSMVVARGLFVAVTVFVLTVLAGTYVINHLLPPVYQATAEIEVKPTMSVDGPPPEGTTLDPAQIETEIAIIGSPKVLMPVVQELGLDKIWAKRIFAHQNPPTKKDAVVLLQRILRLALRRGTDIADITVASDLPKEAADIANAIADQYQLQREMDEKDLTEHAKDAINNEIDQQQQLISEKEAALEKIKKGLEQKGIQISPEASGQGSDDLRPYWATQRDLDRQKALLDALVLHLRQVIDNYQLAESPVLILVRAEPPQPSGRPNHHLDIILTFVVAGFLGVGIASSMEVVFLIARAAQRPENY